MHKIQSDLTMSLLFLKPFSSFWLSWRWHPQWLQGSPPFGSCLYIVAHLISYHVGHVSVFRTCYAISCTSLVLNISLNVSPLSSLVIPNLNPGPLPHSQTRLMVPLNLCLSSPTLSYLWNLKLLSFLVYKLLKGRTVFILFTIIISSLPHMK